MPYRRTAAVDDRLSAARERLVAAATDVIAARGWGGASVTAVAATAGMAVGSVYQHFDSKAALAVEVFRRVAGREVRVLVDVLAGDGGPVERLARAVATVARRALDGRGLAYALLAAPSEPAVEHERLEFRRRYRDIFATAIRDGIRQGMLPPQDADLTAVALTGALGEVLVGPLAAPVDGADAERLVTQVTAMALRCAGASAPGAAGYPP